MPTPTRRSSYKAAFVHPSVSRPAVLVAALFAVTACSDKAKEDINTLSEAGQAMAAVASGSMEAAANDAAKFQADRRARGDTVAMPYTELQKMLPGSISGYAASEEPGGSSQSMGAFSMSEA